MYIPSDGRASVMEYLLYVTQIEDINLCTVNCNSDVTFDVTQLNITNNSRIRRTFICNFIAQREE